MTPKQARFVAEYLIDLNGTQAAIRAGYSPKTANEQASRLLAKANISAEVKARQAKQLETLDFDAARILQEIGRLALADRRSFYREDGTPKAMSELTAAQGAALADVEILVRNVEAGDGRSDMVHKFKLWDKPKALDMLAKHFGILTEKVEHSGGLSITWLTSE